MRAWVFALGATVATAVIATSVGLKLRSELARDMSSAVAPPAPSFPGGRDALNNITSDPYVGPEACVDCHDDNYQSWLGHPHRRMNQLASPRSVLGDFKHRVVEFEGATVTFDLATTDGGRTPEDAGPGDVYTMSLEQASNRRSYRITRTIGVRLKQYYAGVVTEGAPMGNHRATDEVVLPFGFWLAQQRWMPVTYFDPYGDDTHGGGQRSFDPLHPPDAVLTNGCAYCHNTMPYLDRLGIERAEFRGFLSKNLALDPIGLRAELGKSFALGDLPGFPPGIQSQFDLSRDLVTVGISCESCHFGARAHAIDGKAYQFGPSSPHLNLHPADATQSPDRTKDNAWLVNGICRQCHSSSGTFYPDGSATENSRESLELDHGACASKIACTNCHNPHRAGPAEEAARDRPEQVAACTGCHAKYEDGRAAQLHTHHTSEQASCLDCHMPRITHGVNRTVRSHRISSPGDPRMLAAAAPNACNGCHVDRSIAWTMGELSRGWGEKLDLQESWSAAWGGSLETPAMDAWQKSSDQHVKLFLIEALGRRQDDDSLHRLVSLLDDSAGTTRAFAAMAIGRRRGRWLDATEVDVTASHEARAVQIAALAPTLQATPPHGSRPR